MGRGSPHTTPLGAFGASILAPSALDLGVFGASSLNPPHWKFLATPLCGMTPRTVRINIETRISPSWGRVWEWARIWMWQQNQRCRFYLAFHCNSWYILLSFRDMTTGRTRDKWMTPSRRDGWIDVCEHRSLAHGAGQHESYVSNIRCDVTWDAKCWEIKKLPRQKILIYSSRSQNLSITSVIQRIFQQQIRC